VEVPEFSELLVHIYQFTQYYLPKIVTTRQHQISLKATSLACYVNFCLIHITIMEWFFCLKFMASWMLCCVNW